jgi:hypothetical protein
MTRRALAILGITLAVMGCTEEDSYGLRRPRGPYSAGNTLADEESDLTTATADDAVASDAEGRSSTADAAAPRPSPFAAATPYAPIAPGKQSASHHAGSSNAGMDCLSCHTGKGAPRFVVAGTVFQSAAVQVGVPLAQVRIVDPRGTEVALVTTDASGNFWLASPTLVLPAGSSVGVRDATTTRAMQATLGSGSCNQSACHVGTRPLSLR